MQFLSHGKSGKREVAVALLIFWAYIGGYLFLWIPAERVQLYRELYGTITTAVFAFAMAAFGFQAAAQAGLFTKKPQKDDAP